MSLVKAIIKQLSIWCVEFTEDYRLRAATLRMHNMGALSKPMKNEIFEIIEHVENKESE